MDIKNIANILKYFSILAAFFSLITISYQLIIYHNNPSKRTEGMKAFMHILIGVFIVSNVLVISSFLVTTSKSINHIGESQIAGMEDVKVEFDKDEGNFLEKSIATVIDCVNNFVLGNDKKNKEGLAKKLLGFDNLDDIFFEKSSLSLSGVSSGNKPQGNISYGPFTITEWNICLSVYYTILTFLVAPLIVLMVGKTGISYIYNAKSISKLEEIKEDFKRWIFVIILLAIAPTLLELFFSFIGALSDIWYEKFNKTIKSSAIMSGGSFKDLKSGSVLVTAILRFLYCGCYLKINAAFIARKWCLIIMFSLSPIIFCLWGINKKVHAFDIWIGEVVTNGVMGLTYGMVFTIISLFIAKGTNIIMLIIGMSMAVSLAEMLRNGLQGLFTRMSGINEVREGVKGLGVASGIAAGAFNLFKSSGSGNFKNALSSSGDSFSNAFSQKGSSSNSSRNTSSDNDGGADSSISKSANPYQSQSSDNTEDSNSDILGNESNGNSILPSDNMSSTSQPSNSFSLNKPTNSNNSNASSNVSTSPNQNLSNPYSNSSDNISSNNIGTANSNLNNTYSNSNNEESWDGVNNNALYSDISSNNLSPENSDTINDPFVNKNLNSNATEPNLDVNFKHGNASTSFKGTDGVNYLKTKIGEDQEFSNVLGQKYTQYKNNGVGNLVGSIATGGDPQLNKISRDISSVVGGFSNTVSMGKAIYAASNHIASQRLGGKAGFKDTIKTANEMLNMKSVSKNSNGNGVDYHQKNGTSIVQGTRLLGSATFGNDAKVGRLLVNNSMQNKLNKTYIDWSKLGTREVKN